jgi:hypothetical protein
MNAAQAVQKVVSALLANGSKKATLYLDSKTVVSACRRFKRPTRYNYEDFVLKIGRPNYLERQFLRTCKAAGEPLPVRKVQLKPWPVKRA